MEGEVLEVETGLSITDLEGIAVGGDFRNHTLDLLVLGTTQRVTQNAQTLSHTKYTRLETGDQEKSPLTSPEKYLSMRLREAL